MNCVLTVYAVNFAGNTHISPCYHAASYFVIKIYYWKLDLPSERLAFLTDSAVVYIS